MISMRRRNMIQFLGKQAKSNRWKKAEVAESALGNSVVLKDKPPGLPLPENGSAEPGAHQKNLQ
jgi:hypothetical protein